MYRRTRKYAARRKWHPRPAVAPEDQRAPAWQPPDLRRRITIEDFDGAEPRVHVIELHRTNRIDSYRAVIDGKPWKPFGRTRVGWSVVTDAMRRAMPRMASTRNAE